jgi:hypothetical protein
MFVPRAYTLASHEHVVRVERTTGNASNGSRPRVLVGTRRERAGKVTLGATRPCRSWVRTNGRLLALARS